MTELNSKIVENVERRYIDLQSQFVVEEGPSGLADAMTFTNNQLVLVHRLFSFKEAFGANLFDFLTIDRGRMRESDGLWYKEKEIAFNLEYHLERPDFEAPIRMFAEPK
jgi:hypothetical protein